MAPVINVSPLQENYFNITQKYNYCKHIQTPRLLEATLKEEYSVIALTLQNKTHIIDYMRVKSNICNYSCIIEQTCCIKELEHSKE